MSRIGRALVSLPRDVHVGFSDSEAWVKGKLGELRCNIPQEVELSLEGRTLKVSPRGRSLRERALWGTLRATLANMVRGVSEGFSKNLDINGVGYRAAVQSTTLELQLGFSHEVNIPIPDGIQIKCAKPTQISVFGIDRQKVGAIAATIRSLRPPEPYKGKGIKYAEETVLRKEGKKK